MGKSKKNTEKESAISGERIELKRRDFFTLLGGGIIMYFGTRNPSELMALPLLQRREVPEDYNAYFRFDENGIVHLHVGKIEMGQGPITSLPQQAADELDVSIESINLVMGDTLLCPYDAGTWGSLTTWVFSNILRAAAAEARGVLLQMGSEYLDIPLEDLQVKNGVISGISNPKKQVSYGELAKGKQIEKYLDVKPPVKDHTQFHYVGQSRLRADSKPKVMIVASRLLSIVFGMPTTGIPISKSCWAIVREPSPPIHTNPRRPNSLKLRYASPSISSGTRRTSP